MDAILFWTAAVLLTAIATIAVVWPLLRRQPKAVATRAEHDAEVYGAQLAELKADVARGIMPAEEEATARAEIGRRLLRASAEADGQRSLRRGSGRVALFASLALALFAVPIASLVAYRELGSPEQPDLPLQARLAVDPATADLPTLVAQAEARLRTNPGDGAGWDRLGPIYLRSGRADDAANAFANASRLLGATAEREAGRGEALTQAAAGEVTDAAKASFERALALNADYLPAKFFLALDLSQESRFADAAPAWQALIDASPEGSPWLELAGLALGDARTKLAAEGPASATASAAVSGAEAGARRPAGPSGQDIAAASQMSAADRSAMIEGMVSQLAARLKSAPNDVEGWKRLVQSYSVLGDGARARTALSDALEVFAAGSAERGEIESFASGLGL